MNKPQILVVEDDTAVGNLITTTLETQNYLFHRAKTGAGRSVDALSYRPDVILLGLGPARYGRRHPHSKNPLLEQSAHHCHLRPQRGQRQGLRPGRRRR